MVEAVSQMWVCQAWHCGEVYAGTERFCPSCRNVAMPQKSVRRRGVVLIVCGVFLVGMMAALTLFLAPLMFAPQLAPGGTGFSGTRSDATVILALFGAVALFGVVALVAGYIQLRYGRQNWRVFGGMIAVLAVICTTGWLILNGFLLSAP